jgi:hypothetical protein
MMIDCDDSSRPLYKKTTDELGELLFWNSLVGFSIWPDEWRVFGGLSINKVVDSAGASATLTSQPVVSWVRVGSDLRIGRGRRAILPYCGTGGSGLRPIDTASCGTDAERTVNSFRQRMLNFIFRTGRDQGQTGRLQQTMFHREEFRSPAHNKPN